MSADTGYAGAGAQDIQILLGQRMPAKLVAGRLNRPTQAKARILDTLQKERFAGRYTGLDNTS